MIRRILLSAVALPLAGPLAAQIKAAVTPADYGKWESLAPAALSPNGQWLAYGVNRVSEENELRIRGVNRDTTIVVRYAVTPAFSADSRWIAYAIGVSPATRDRLEREKKPVHNALGFRELGGSKGDSVTDVASFRFSPDGRYLAMRRYPAEGKRVADLIVVDLAAGARTTLGSVSDFSWAERRPLLALTLETEGGAGNAIQVLDATTNAIRVLESSPSLYRGLSWRPKSEDLAVLRTRVDKAFKDTTHVVLAWTALGSGQPVASSLDPALGSVIPGDLRIAESRRPEWSKDGATLLIGLRPRQPADTSRARADTGKTAGTPATSSPPEKVSDVQVWHSKDVRLMRMQELQEQPDLQRTLVVAWHPGDGKLTRIGTDLFETVSVLGSAGFATESDRKPYAWGQMFGRPFSDVWLVNTRTGQRSKAIEKVRWSYGGSPSGGKLLWYDGKDYWTYDVHTGLRTNLTGSLRADFSNPDWDYPGDLRPPSGIAGWSKDEHSLLVYDKYDLWSVAADGSGGRRLTNGRPERIVYRYARTSNDEDGIDLSKRLYLAMSGELTKQFGYARLLPGKPPERLLFANERITRLLRADSTEVFAYTRENFDDPPDWFVGGPGLTDARQLSSLNPFQQQYAWGKSEVVDFMSAAELPLQAALFYPANFDPAKKYPMIVYTYELLSQGVHNYVVPSERSYYNLAVWTAQGYFVLEPDIVFRGRDPGISVLEAVEPAVRAIVARGLVDSARIGHIGHSWGGYEAAFLPTRSHLFAAGVAGAAITNFLSFNGAVHWSGGNAEYDHWETGQARMDVPPWEDLDAYLRNSPIAKIQDLKTPLLVEAGDADGTVEWHQSMEFYNSARRAGRPDLVMLLYPGEDHGLRKKENQIDYHRRINEWFGHYLKGEPAPKWISSGVTWLERKELLDGSKAPLPAPVRP
jgi:dipeptidyl aminopeptidase/acylaminoacyl peptidase